MEKAKQARRPETKDDGKRFLAKFLGIFFALFIILHLLDVTAISNFLAGAEAAALNSAGFHAAAQGHTLHAGNTEFLFVTDCTGLVMVILFAALLYSTNVPEDERRRALLVYAPLLLAFNFARLFFTIAAGTMAPHLLDAIHAALWFVDSGVVLYAWSHVLGRRKAF